MNHKSGALLAKRPRFFYCLKGNEERAMGYKKVVFNRDKLYEQVWEKPMIALAKEIGRAHV